MNVFHAVFYYEFALVGDGVDVFQFGKELGEFIFLQESDAFDSKPCASKVSLRIIAKDVSSSTSNTFILFIVSFLLFTFLPFYL